MTMEFLTYDEEDESVFSLSYVKIIYLDLSSIRYNHKIPIVFETKECNFRKYNTTEEQKLSLTGHVWDFPTRVHWSLKERDC
jgi:hypothetical protein